MAIIEKVFLCLTIIGAINWGLIGLLDFNLVTYLFGNKSLLTNIIYSLVGLSGLINIGILFSSMKFNMLENK